jgi:tetratricopeptide (TPR) repeat protein
MDKGLSVNDVGTTRGGRVRAEIVDQRNCMPDNHIGVEPLRTDPTDAGPSSDADRAARIEQLLLSGLDHYFGGNYEQAINVWTRVAFLERGHGRARAYIDRARSALAERQRESEESLDQGLAAYHSGDLQRARDLLTRAVEQGGANETALLFLQRIGHLDAVAAPARPERAASRPVPLRRLPVPGPRSRIDWLTTAVASAALAGVILLGALRTASWLRESPVSVRNGDSVAHDSLPIVRDGEQRMDRARALRASGRLREALRELDVVQLGDPLRPQADRLRSEIQRLLLSATPAAASAVGEQSR